MTISTSLVPEKATRTSQGVTVMSLKKDSRVIFVTDRIDEYTPSKKSYRKNKLPSSGLTLYDEDISAMPDSVKELIK